MRRFTVVELIEELQKHEYPAGALTNVEEVRFTGKEVEVKVKEPSHVE